MSNFNHYDLSLVTPRFDSNLTDLIVELDYLRKKQLYGTTHPRVFFQLKSLFHTLESIGSARIEGNHTTIAEYIDTKIGNEKSTDEKILEIRNLEECMEFIDSNIKEAKVNRIFVSELHKRIVQSLSKEGSKTPGEYRQKDIIIAKAEHRPPDYTKISDYMEELFSFIDKEDAPKYDLLKIALVHHRFAWVHPFDNGNGRTVRLLTYAMLVQQGFNVDVGRIINPTAVFCINREDYYNALAEADKGTKEGLLFWCEYMLKGLKQEIEKIDNLLDYNFLKSKILYPAIAFSRDRGIINEIETKILRKVIEKQEIQTSDIESITGNKSAAANSRVLRQLRDKKMIVPEADKARKYVLNFSDNYLIRGVIKSLADNDFLPLKEEFRL